MLKQKTGKKGIKNIPYWERRQWAFLFAYDERKNPLWVMPRWDNLRQAYDAQLRHLGPESRKALLGWLRKAQIDRTTGVYAFVNLYRLLGEDLEKIEPWLDAFKNNTGALYYLLELGVLQQWLERGYGLPRLLEWVSVLPSERFMELPQLEALYKDYPVEEAINATTLAHLFAAEGVNSLTFRSREYVAWLKEHLPHKGNIRWVYHKCWPWR